MGSIDWIYLMNYINCIQSITWHKEWRTRVSNPEPTD